MFTLAAKAGEPGPAEAARLIGATLSPLPLAALEREAARILTPSPVAQARFGAPAIAEAAALAGAGSGGRLLGPRLAADGATCAVALSRGTWHDRAFHRRRARRARPDHRQGTRPRRPLPRLPLCRLARAEGAARPLPARRDDRRHRAARPRQDHALCVEATAAGKDVARLHSGDLSIWSAMGEQIAPARPGRACPMT